jgi:hypothetical protein
MAFGLVIGFPLTTRVCTSQITITDQCSLHCVVTSSNRGPSSDSRLLTALGFLTVSTQTTQKTPFPTVSLIIMAFDTQQSPMQCWIFTQPLPSTVYRLSANMSQTKRNSMVWVCDRTIPNEQTPLVSEVVPTSADTGCHVVSATDPPRPYSRFSRQGKYVTPYISTKLII